MVRGWCLPWFCHVAYIFALFRWRKYHHKHRRDTKFHQLQYSDGMMPFSHNCNIQHYHKLLIHTKYEEKGRKIINKHKIWILATVPDSVSGYQAKDYHHSFFFRYPVHISLTLCYIFSWMDVVSQISIPEIFEIIVQSLLGCCNFLLRKWLALR